MRDPKTYFGIGIGAIGGAITGYVVAPALLGTGTLDFVATIGYYMQQGVSMGLSLSNIGSSLSLTTWGAYGLGGATIFGSYSLYNSGLGTSSMKPGEFEQDFTVGVYGTYGRGSGAGMPVYGINGFTQAGYDYYQNSISAGQMVTYNSGTRSFTQQGMLNVRSGDASFYYHNDSKKFPSFGGGIDQAWTAGAKVSSRNLSGRIDAYGFETFTGIEPKNKKTWPIGPNSTWHQDLYQQSLNKAINYTTNRGITNPVDFKPGYQNWVHDNLTHGARFLFTWNQ